MTSATGQNDIDRVRDATDLVRLIGEHVALTPRGREHVGLCPFHDDHRPSMAVVTHKGNGFYNCFACGASGDCFRFAMDYHKMDFGEALRYLADRAGIQLTPLSDRSSTAAARGDGASRQDLLKALSFAGEFFRQTLQDQGLGAAAREALATRGLDEAMIEHFGIGAAPAGFSAFLDRLGGKPSAIRTATSAGLLRERSSGGHYDAFRNRLMFPIHDEMGRTIAFGGRIVDPEDQPKYLNSPESPVFNKSRTLYGLHLARRAIIDAGEAIVTEGYTDVIACHRAGITNVIGTLGTSLTTQHASALARLCPSVVLVFDGDEAGQKAADRAVEVFFREPVDVRICVLPDDLDPDDLLGREDGRQCFLGAVASASDALEFKLERFQRGLGGTGGLSARQRAVEGFLRELADLGFGGMQGVRKRLVLTRLADLTGLPIPAIEAAMPRQAPRRPEVAAPVPSGDPADHGEPPPLLTEFRDMPQASRARVIAERDLLAVLLVEPEVGREPCIPESEGDAKCLVTAVIGPTDFVDPIAREIAAVILRGLEGDQEDGRIPGMSEVLSQLPEGPAPAVAAELFREGSRRLGDDTAAASAALVEAVETFRRCVDREAYQTKAGQVPGSGGPTPPAAGEDLAAVLDHIRKRNQQGDMPAAISQGVRS